MILTSLRLVRQSQVSIRFSKRFLTTTSIKAQPAIPTRLPAATHQRSKTAVPARSRQPVPFNRSRAELARKLYTKGVRQVYAAPSPVGWTILSWAIGTVLIGGSINLMLIRNWDSENLHGMGAWQKMFVTGANRVGMFFMTALGGYALVRYTGFIRSIRLVEISPNEIGMRIFIRRRTPFSETLYTVPPGDIVMPRDWRRHLPRTDSQSRRYSLGSIIGAPFKLFKDFLLMKGVVAPVRFNDNNTSGMMDPAGIKLSADDFDILTREASE